MIPLPKYTRTMTISPMTSLRLDFPLEQIHLLYLTPSHPSSLPSYLQHGPTAHFRTTYDPS
jgi:hypothetical protein